MMKLPIIGVMGSGTQPHGPRAEQLGRWLAEQPVHLLTGGGGGVMASICRAFGETPNRRGLVIGVLPAGADGCGAPAGYPNPWVEIAIRTHLPLSGSHGTEPMSRNHINILSSAAVVVLPGGAGTASEAHLAIRYGRPIVAYLDSREQVPGLPEAVEVRAEFATVTRFLLRVLAGLRAPEA